MWSQRCLLIAAIWIAAWTPSADAEILLGSPTTQGGGSLVNAGDVYGEATFELRSHGGVDINEAVFGLIKQIIEDTYGNRDGSYLLTIELYQKGKPVTIKPILSVSIKEKKFLFWTISSQISRDIYFSGQLAEVDPITSDNNRVEVVVKSYYKANSAFDLSLFELIDIFGKEFKIAEKLDAIGLAAAPIKKVKELVEKSLQQADARTDQAKVYSKRPTRREATY